MSKVGKRGQHVQYWVSPAGDYLMGQTPEQKVFYSWQMCKGFSVGPVEKHLPKREELEECHEQCGGDA